MDDDTLEAMKIVIGYLDEEMEENPSRKIMEVSNYLQDMVDRN